MGHGAMKSANLPKGSIQSDLFIEDLTGGYIEDKGKGADSSAYMIDA
jgi:hypothetical protein